MITITSEHNNRVKHLVKLQTDKNYRYRHNEYIVEGIRALDSLSHIKELFIRDDQKNVMAACSKKYLISRKIFNKISGTEQSQGVMAVVSFKIYILNMFKKNNIYILLDRIQDPGNMGTIIRTAAAFNTRHIVLTHGCVDPFSPKAVRASMGAIDKVKIIKLDKLQDLRGFTIITTTTCGDHLNNFTWPKHYMLAIGNEAHGVSNEINHYAQHTISIPISKYVESLNASIALGILLHTSKQGA